jgi:hypothetical protein
VTVLFDAGALIALERDERSIWIRLEKIVAKGEIPVTHAGVLGQVWRSGPRQARLVRALGNITVRPLDEGLGRAAGVLIGVTGRPDVIDAALVLLAHEGDEIVTSDPGDLRALVAASGRRIALIRP